jgi:flagellar assembly protein FliH
MAARVLDPETADIQPPHWRERAVEPAPVRRPPPSPDPGGQLASCLAKLAQLSSEMPAKLAQAREAGFREGEAAGSQSASAGVEDVLKRLADAIGQLADTRREVIRRAEADVVLLSIEIARRVLHRELSIDRSALEALIKAALSKLESQEVYRVRVSPDHEDLLRRCLLDSGRGSAVEVIPDPAQPLGGAVFELHRGLLDASVDTQLREIERGLVDQLQGSQ